MVIFIFKSNSLVKNSCVEIALAEIICKLLQKRNCRPPLVLSKMCHFLKLLFIQERSAKFNFKVQSFCKKQLCGNSNCRENL